MKTKTIIKISVTVIILLSLSLWIKSRYNVWFGNPPEAAYSPLQEPGRILLSFGDTSALSRNISWQCDSVLVPSFAEVVDIAAQDTFKQEAKGEIFQSRSGKAAYYVVKLRGLKSDNQYAYRVFNGEKKSSWYSFNTQNGKTASDFSFMFVGDVQDTIQGNTNKYLRQALKAHPESEFLLCGGDLTERPTDAYWGETFRGLDSISTHLPVLNVTGNHEYLKHVIRKLERRFSLIFSYYLDSMVGENQVFTFRYNDAQFFFLDSNREFFYLWTQRKWLKEQLKKSQAHWKIVVLHHPLYSIKGKNNNLTQRLLFGDIINETNVDLVLQGHEHSYGRMTSVGKDSIATTPVYTISHCSPKRYKARNTIGFDKVDFQKKCYQMIHFHGDTLQMTSYDAETGKAFDQLSILKGDQQAVIKEGM